MDRSRFESLLLAYRDGRATEGEQAELARLLREDASCRREFFELFRMEADLQTFYSSYTPAARATRRRLGRPVSTASAAGWVAAAAAALVVIGLLFMNSSLPEPDAPRRTTAKSQPLPPPPLTEKPAAAPESAPAAITAPLPPPLEKPSELPVPAPAPQVPPTPAPEKPPAAVPAPPIPPQETRPAVCSIESVEGAADHLGPDGLRRPAVKGISLQSGDGLETRAASRLSLVFADGTRVQIDPETEIRNLKETDGKRIVLSRGTVTATVSRQPAGRPMVMTTPHGDATVLGTTLRLAVDPEMTRLEVTEGKVRLKRLSDGKSVEVLSGYYAVAAAGIEMAPRPIPLDEIVLGHSNGAIVGREWRRLKDERASSGEALEAADTANAPKVSSGSPDDPQAAIRARQEWFARGRSRSWVAFTFQADADKEYFMWVRGECRWTEKGRGVHDAVMMQVANGRFVNRPKDWPQYTDEFCVFGGFGDHEGYWWSGGQNEPGWTMTPISIRFHASGRQTLLMHAAETPMRIDAIWISATQRTRPDPRDTGPARQ